MYWLKVWGGIDSENVIPYELYVVMQKRFIKEKLARESIQLLHDPATDRNTAQFQLDVKEFHKILQAGGAVHAVGVLVQLFKIFFHLVVFVPNFTNQFFQNILHRNNTKRSTKIIYNDGCGTWQ